MTEMERKGDFCVFLVYQMYKYDPPLILLVRGNNMGNKKYTDYIMIPFSYFTKLITNRLIQSLIHELILRINIFIFPTIWFMLGWLHRFISTKLGKYITITIL